MSRSSAASKRSFASSKPFAARLDSIVPALHGIAEAPGLVALRFALRVSFGGFILGIVAFALSAQTGNVLLRIAASVVPALGVMSCVLVVALAIELARRFEIGVLPFIAGTAAAFELALPPRSSTEAVAVFRVLGQSGLLLAIVVCFATLGIVLALRTMTSNRVASWLGAIYVVAIALWLARFGISLGALIAASLGPLGRLGDSYGALATIVLLETLLWMVGIHGPALLAAIVTPVYLILQAENASAFASGAPLPHLVTTSTFLFVFPGGAGATLPLVVLMLRSRLRNARRLAAAVVAPALFGINEPLLFGLPVVFEPILAVPFVAAPLVLSATTYAALASGLVARPAYYVPASIPPILNAFMATADWRACILAVVNLLLAAAIYAPFLRLYERSREASGA